MLGNGVEMSLIFCRILGPLVLGWTPNHFGLGGQLAPGEDRLVCIPEFLCHSFYFKSVFSDFKNAIKRIFKKLYCCHVLSMVSNRFAPSRVAPSPFIPNLMPYTL